MKHRTIHALLAMAMPICLAHLALGADLTVEIVSHQGAPTVVAAEQPGKPSARMTTTPANTAVYHHNLPKQVAPVWVVRSIVIARWPDAEQELRLRMTEAMIRPVAVKILHYLPVADENTLTRLEGLGDHFDALLERYFVARDVYRKIAKPGHKISIFAMKIWYDAAVQLCQRFPFIDCDTEIMEKLRKLEEDAETDESLRKLLRARFKEGYIKAMNQQLKALEWRDVALVGSEIQSGRIENAALINQHFVQRYSRLSADDQKRITRAQGVDGKLLQGNTRLLNTLLNR